MGENTNLHFDLEKLFETMILSQLDPEKSIMQYAAEEMVLLGNCFIVASKTPLMIDKREVEDEDLLPF